MEEDKNVSVDTINYRLGQIEESLADLKSVLLESKLQEKEIEYIKSKLEDLEEKQILLKDRIKALEEKPGKDSQAKWKFISDLILKIIITGAVTFILVKIGFPVG